MPYYRPPSSSSSLGDLNSVLLSTPIQKFKSFILLGNFNIKFLPNSTNTPLHQELSAITDQLDLHQIVSEPTRCSTRSSSLIDLVFTPNPSAMTFYSTLHPLGSSDHKTLFLSLSWTVPSPCSIHLTIWRYSDADFDVINETLSRLLSAVTKLGDIDLFWNKRKNLFFSTVQKYIHLIVL